VRLRYLVMLAVAIAAAALYVGVKPGVREFKEVDELGEWHEVVVAGPYVVIKHGPSAHQRDFDKAMKYIEARRASWERWKKLLDKYRDETYKAYVVPCRIYTFEEFSTLAKSLGLTDKTVGVVTYVYYKNGTYESMGGGVRPEGYNFDEWLELTRETAFISTGIRMLLPERRRDGTGTPPPFNVTEAVELGRSVAEVYVGAFVVEAPLKELYALSKRPEILMVDTPLDLIWKYRKEGKTVEVKRVTHGDRYLIEKKNLCQVKGN
jgi:plasmid stabilization system protein ParE